MKKSVMPEITLFDNLNNGTEIESSNELSSVIYPYLVPEELFEAMPKKRIKSSSTFKEGEKIVFADLKEGDYIVHKNHFSIFLILSWSHTLALLSCDLDAPSVIPSFCAIS